MNIAICYCYLNIAIHLSFDHCYDHTHPAYVISMVDKSTDHGKLLSIC